MQQIFNSLVTDFIDNKVGIAQNFLSASLTKQLKQNLLNLYRDKKMQAAGIGNALLSLQNTAIRGDRIYWLDRKNKNIYENEFFDVMDNFVSYLNETCYTGITGYEFHYAWYDKGSYYKKHLDQFRNNDSRKYSMILYLNDNWKEKDGGQLCIHHNNRLQTIAPENGKSVFFKSSELEHEVLLTNKPRLSITGWLKI